MYEISLALDGDGIDAKTFLHAVSTLLRLLSSLDQDGLVRWRLATLRYSSPATVGLAGESRKRQAAYGPADVGRSAVSGLAALDRGTRPAAFSDEALEQARKLAEIRGKGGVRGLLVMDQNDGRPETLAISHRVSASVEEFIGARFQSIGSIEGRLEVVSSHGGVLRCNIYERLLGKVVRCDVPSGMKKTVLDCFDEEVVAEGIVRRDASGQAREIALQTLSRVERPPGAPRSLAGLAPDYTDGVDSVEYIKGRWR